MNKIKKTIVLLCLVTIGFSATNCYGPFKLTKKLHAWNGTLGDKYINALVFIGLNIVPIYEIAIVVDGVVLNSIQFWTGDNPIAMNEGDKESKLITEAGKTYQITASKNQFDVVQLVGPNAGEKAAFVFEPTTKVWNLRSGSINVELVKVVENDNQTIVEAYTPKSTQYFNLDGSEVQTLSVAK